jgi:hypothetical protein
LYSKASGTIFCSFFFPWAGGSNLFCFLRDSGEFSQGVLVESNLIKSRRVNKQVRRTTNLFENEVLSGANLTGNHNI